MTNRTKHKLDLLLEAAMQGALKQRCSVGSWSFEANREDSCIISYDGGTVAAWTGHEITEVLWGRRIEDITTCDILEKLFVHLPQLHLDVMSVRTDDCLAALGYDGPSYPIADIPGLEDIDYYRAWVTWKANHTDPETTDYVVYWDQGNTWCEIRASFEGITHELFVEKLHEKYNEWIQKETSSLDHMLESVSSRTVESQASSRSAQPTISAQSNQPPRE